MENLCSIVLRDYQIQLNKRVGDQFRLGLQRVLVVSPTGSGKGMLIVHHAERLAAVGRHVLVLAPTREIRDQISAALTAAGVPHGVIAPNTAKVDANVQISTVATMAQQKRRDQWRDWADWILGDEAHHFAARTWRSVVADQPRTRVAGYTATPVRADGAPLGDMFDEIVIGPSTAELIASGFLSSFQVFAHSTPDLSGLSKRVGDYEIKALRARMSGTVVSAAVREYQQRCSGVRAVVYCVDRAHGATVEDAFLADGVRAKFIDGDTNDVERRAAIAGLGDGGLDVLVNCGLISEGVDIPAIGAVLLLRPTMSLSLHLQQIGRALRPAPGKTRALILDFAGNVERLGFPDEFREWTLSGSINPNPTSRGPRRCSLCTTLNRPSAIRCAECDSDLRTRKERREAEVALTEVRRREEEDAYRRLPLQEALKVAGPSYERLLQLARARGYRSGWAFYKLQEMLAGVSNA